ncbi:MAG: amidohydrolase [Deinococcota bacterium]|jgi:amidohydrolase|nr:amidohydrolase [Deinococcota bacterium]
MQRESSARQAYERIDAQIAGLRPLLLELSHKIHAHPEIRFEERQASSWLAETLAAHGFAVECGAGGLETAFYARLPGKGAGANSGPKVALVCEYDALEGLGHACGHNVIATMSLGGALALAPLLENLAGELVVVGTPGEEGGGGKVILLEAGVFDGLDAAMMIHPSYETRVGGPSLARVGWEVRYSGVPAHAAAAPHLGVNALDAVRLAFSGLDALRQQVTPDVRIHGVVTHGGDAVNIIPKEAAMRVFLRAASKDYLYDSLVPRARKVFEGAALMTGAELTIAESVKPYDNMATNLVLAERFAVHGARLGREVLPYDPLDYGGSTDMGNVSQRLPALHAYLAIDDEAQPHTAGFAEAARSERGDAAVLDGARILASLAHDLLSDGAFLEEVKGASLPRQAA